MYSFHVLINRTSAESAVILNVRWSTVQNNCSFKNQQLHKNNTNAIRLNSNHTSRIIHKLSFNIYKKIIKIRLIQSLFQSATMYCWNAHACWKSSWTRLFLCSFCFWAIGLCFLLKQWLSLCPRYIHPIPAFFTNLQMAEAAKSNHNTIMRVNINSSSHINKWQLSTTPTYIFNSWRVIMGSSLQTYSSELRNMIQQTVLWLFASNRCLLNLGPKKTSRSTIPP